MTGYATHAVSATSQQDIVVSILYASGGPIKEETDWYKVDFAGSAAHKNRGHDIAVANVDADAADEIVVVSSNDLSAYVDTPIKCSGARSLWQPM